MPPKVDLEAASAQFMRALRGEQSQTKFARRAGCTKTTVSSWETGKRSPTALKALQAGEAGGLPVLSVLKNFPLYGTTRDPEISRAGLADWLDDLRGEKRISELADILGTSRFAVGRWLSGTVDLRLPEFLAVLDAITGRIVELVAKLVPIEQVPALSSRFDAWQRVNRSAAQEPWAIAIMCAIATEGYRGLASHSDAWIAECLGIDEPTVRRCTAALEESGVISTQDARFVVSPKHLGMYFLSQDQEVVIRNARHWLRVASERLARDSRPDEKCQYTVFSVSREQWAQIRAHVDEAAKQVRAVIDESPANMEQVVGVTLLYAFTP